MWVINSVSPSAPAYYVMSSYTPRSPLDTQHSIRSSVQCSLTHTANQQLAPPCWYNLRLLTVLLLQADGLTTYL
jgi:hypothetical protein